MKKSIPCGTYPDDGDIDKHAINVIINHGGCTASAMINTLEEFSYMKFRALSMAFAITAAVFTANAHSAEIKPPKMPSWTEPDMERQNREYVKKNMRSSKAKKPCKGGAENCKPRPKK